MNKVFLVKTDDINNIDFVTELSTEELDHIIRCVEDSFYRSTPRDYDYRVECRALLKKLEGFSAIAPKTEPPRKSPA